ncbi:IS200/IS605 family transposase [Nostoc sp. PCC 7107]|uniref:IS200/IS605 family transposase n=1 Tax=Nostoc sp. PCC 7107 TaxID=317936 RepID=UPI00029EDA06|nr:IS200/IS605 family transposase [Nostoc sp. PCC 7107]AFY44675.1 transposase IS200-family protein [Nostoc sp. PCC 7107]
MAFWRLYYHLVWATKERQPLITHDKEAELYNYIIGKADFLNSIIHAIGGIEDHIHLIASIPPSLSIADFVKNIKGSSTHFLNQNYHISNNAIIFGWQRGYGVLSLGSKQLDNAVSYVRNQKNHHSQGTAIASLEKHDDEA